MASRPKRKYVLLFVNKMLYWRHFIKIYIKKIKIFLEKDLLETMRMIFTMRTVIVMDEMMNLLL